MDREEEPMDREEEPAAKRERSEKSQDQLVIDAVDLFRGGQEIWIDHGGVRYRLRITRRNKLILQK